MTARGITYRNIDKYIGRRVRVKSDHPMMTNQIGEIAGLSLSGNLCVYFSEYNEDLHGGTNRFPEHITPTYPYIIGHYWFYNPHRLNLLPHYENDIRRINDEI